MMDGFDLYTVKDGFNLLVSIVNLMLVGQWGLGTLRVSLIF